MSEVLRARHQELTHLTEAASGLPSKSHVKNADRKKQVLELLMGDSLSVAAAQAEVSRTTVYRWFKQDTAFRNAYADWMEEYRHSVRMGVLTLSWPALASVRRAVAAGDAKLGLQLLKQLGFLGKIDRQEIIESGEKLAEALEDLDNPGSD